MDKQLAAGLQLQRSSPASSKHRVVQWCLLIAFLAYWTPDEFCSLWSLKDTIILLCCFTRRFKCCVPNLFSYVLYTFMQLARNDPLKWLNGIVCRLCDASIPLRYVARRYELVRDAVGVWFKQVHVVRQCERFIPQLAHWDGWYDF